MKTTTKTLPQSRVELSITVDAATWMKEIEAAAAHIGAQMKVPGFRAGKVPASVVEREVSRSALLAEAAERAIKKAYAKAVREHNISAIDTPTVSVDTLEDGKDLVFTATVDVLPTATLVKDYEKKLKAAITCPAPEEVRDEDVEKEIDRLAQQRATEVVVTRAAQNGDVVRIDFSATIDGAPLEGGSGNNHPLTLGSGAFIPGFEDAIVGMTAGETKTIPLSFPKDYHAKDIAGKEAIFTVTVIGVYERVAPEVDDVFAATILGKKDATREDLLRETRTALTAQRRQTARQACRESIADALAEVVECEIPAAMIDQEVRRMEEQFMQQLSASGTTLDALLKRMNKTKEELRADWRPQGEKRAKISLALDAVAEQEHIQPSKDAVEAQMQQLRMMYATTSDSDVDLAQLHSYAKAMLTQEAVFEHIENRVGAPRYDDAPEKQSQKEKSETTKKDKTVENADASSAAQKDDVNRADSSRGNAS